MEFRTRFSKTESKVKLDHQKGILLIGSCFSSNVGEKLKYFKFPIQINPFGTLFQPMAISNALARIIESKSFSVTDLIQFDERFYSPFHYHAFSSDDANSLINKMNKSLEESKLFLKQANCVIVTLGSAWAYQHKPSGQLVANCHKIPQNNFQKRLLSIKEMTGSLSTQIGKLQQKEIIITVSPVRHLKDGFIENNRSKARLIEVAHQLSDTFTNTQYFPSYELMMDDLRDYRFYSDDMVHPNHLAIQYLWDFFSETFFEKETKNLNEQILTFKKMLGHKIMNKHSAEANQFYKNLNQMHKKLTSQHSFLDFSDELAYIPR